MSGRRQTRGVLRPPSAPLPSRLAGRLLDLAFPGHCAGCDVEGPPLCGACIGTLDARLDEPPGVEIGLRSRTPGPLLQLEWCAPFGGTVRRALHQLKYAGERRLADPIGKAVARRWERAGAGGDVIVPVPAHEARRRDRGYDQAALIAAVAGRTVRLPVVEALVRDRATAPQFELDRPSRAGNVSGAFGLRIAAVPAVRDRWIVLVDDVVTTGATLAACASALLVSGAAAVSAITAARED